MNGKSVISVTLSIGLVVAALVLHKTVPGTEDKYAPIATTGDVGEKVTTKKFSITVHRVELAKKVVTGEGEEKVTMTTPGVWLVIPVTATVFKKTITLGGISLHAPGGYVYNEASQRLGSEALSALPLNPAIPERGLVLIETNPSHLAGADLRVQQKYTHQLAPQARVDLGLTGKSVDELRASTHPRYVIEG